MNLAIRWTLDQPGVTVALWGARHPEQCSAVANLDGWAWTPEIVTGWQGSCRKL